MTNETTNSPEKIQEGVEMMFQALSTARKLLGLEVPRSPDIASAIARLGIDPLFLDFRFNKWEVSFNHEIRHAFALGCRVSIEVRYGESGLGPYGVTSEVTWASGGGDCTTALAQASLYLDTVRAVSQADLVLKTAFESLRRTRHVSKTYANDVFAALSARADTALAMVRAEMKETA